MSPDFIFNLQPGDIVYDIETYPNIFTFTAKHSRTHQVYYFEISWRRNDTEMLVLFMRACRDLDCRWVGYNNLGFDYPVVHFIYQYTSACLSVSSIYDKAMAIIKSNGPAKFAHMVWESDHVVKQLDLYKVHHFDNVSKATSLKVLEFNMRMASVEDLPFDVGIHLNDEQADVLKQYNLHDVDATLDFLSLSRSAIEMREQLSAQFGINMINCSDVKIGEKILIHEMEQHGIQCFEYVNGKKMKRQTLRSSIALADVVFPYIQFERQEFENIRQYFLSKTITETKGVFAGLIATVDGLEYKFGTGGLHASVESQTVCSDHQYQLVDIDVASYYPNLGIKNKLYPAHLGEAFCDAYEGLYHTRKRYDKGTTLDAAYKLALVGAYGNSNNEYSPLFDPQYTMSITVNGQLLLCVLAEQLLKVPLLKIIQVNTDGVTYLCPREHLDHTRTICKWWEGLTQLTLEEVLYSRMFIRDVNSYIAEKEGGTLKRIGAYAHETATQNPGTRELPYHKDWSARVVPLAAEAALVHGQDIRSFITSHSDPFDFMLRTKVPRGSSLHWGEAVVSNTVRYYIAVEGQTLEKVMPPAGPAGAYKRANGIPDHYYNEVIAELMHEQFSDSEYALGISHVTEAELVAMLPWDERINTKNKSTYKERRTAFHTGWKVHICNNLEIEVASGMWDDVWNNINYDWYVAEAEKLVNPLRR